MNEKDLRDIIAQVLSEMNVTDTTSATSAAPAQKADTASAATEDGFVEDVAEVDIKKQYLVEHPVAGDAYYELKQYAPCRLGIGKAGARYKTLPVLEFRAAHSAAQDAVFTDEDPEVIEKLGLFTVQTKCDSKDTYLTRPTLVVSSVMKLFRRSKKNAKCIRLYRSMYLTDLVPQQLQPIPLMFFRQFFRALRAMVLKQVHRSL